jgi:hypothetical protein
MKDVVVGCGRVDYRCKQVLKRIQSVVGGGRFVSFSANKAITIDN